MENNKLNKEKLSFMLVKEEDITSFMEAFNMFKEQNAIDDRPYFDLKLCIEELLVNIFKHGYSNINQQPDIQIDMTKVDSKIEVAICDNAKAFNLFKMKLPDSDIDHIEDKNIGGLGIRFIKSFTDELEYIPQVKGNKVILKKFV